MREHQRLINEILDRGGYSTWEREIRRSILNEMSTEELKEILSRIST